MKAPGECCRSSSPRLRAAPSEDQNVSAPMGCWRRLTRFCSWIAPSVVLVLMPKCPACLAAYIAVGTGIGLSLPAAANLRFGLIALSATLLGVLVIRRALRLFAARARSQ